ncbi:MAG: N-acetyltransferase [Clostridiaceae bacterium]|jgi:ribosomal protein S18 acetylase RimI-like enzyme|nr:N-acetyltransferase [Clostridiaceae bacterium]MDF2948625.1 N-acetyltransferase [Sedimentibacter sp.]
METILYKKLELYEINEELFKDFNRYQEVKKCWRKVDGKWVLKNIAFTEQWSKKEYQYLIKCLQNSINTGGKVLGAFCDKKLIGFASVENNLFGLHNEYIQLSCIHTSYEFRGTGVGKKLFFLMCNHAKELGAQKLYISAHSSEETQAFYTAMGCIEAKEYNTELAEHEPCDCQMEYELFK